MLNAVNVSRQPILCAYDGVCVSNDTYWKKRCVGWLDDSNTLFGLYRSNAGSYTQNDFLSTTAFMSTTLSQSFRIVSPIFDEISSLKHLLLSLASTSTKSSIMTLIISTFTLTIAVQHMLEHSKAFHSVFQAVIRCYVHKTRSFRNLHFCPKNYPFPSNITNSESKKTKLLINPAKYSRCICPEMARHSILINISQRQTP